MDIGTGLETDRLLKVLDIIQDKFLELRDAIHSAGLTIEYQADLP